VIVRLLLSLTLATLASPGPAASNRAGPMQIGTGDWGTVTYAVIASARTRRSTVFRLARPGTNVAVFTLTLPDLSGLSFAEAVSSGKTVRSVARGEIMLAVAGPNGEAAERAFLRAMRSPPPKRSLRRAVTFTAIVIDRGHSGEETGGVPADLYKLFGVFPDGEDVELLLAVALDRRSVTFSEKDESYRPDLTRFFSR
jgi:hypothetical protein